MANSTLLTESAKNYLSCYYQILDEMVQSITNARLTQSVSHNFIAQMLPHHRAAVQLCENVLRCARDRAVCQLANAIIAEQNEGIRRLEEVLPVCEKLASPCGDLRLYQRRTDLILRDMFARMAAAPETNCVGADFLREMIPHHQGAVSMARNAMKYPVCVQLAPILRTIAARQSRELARMRALLERGGCGRP